MESIPHENGSLSSHFNISSYSSAKNWLLKCLEDILLRSELMKLHNHFAYVLFLPSFLPIAASLFFFNKNILIHTWNGKKRKI